MRMTGRQVRIVALENSAKYSAYIIVYTVGAASTRLFSVYSEDCQEITRLPSFAAVDFLQRQDDVMLGFDDEPVACLHRGVTVGEQCRRRLAAPV